MTYINNAESAGELSHIDHQAGLVTQAIGHLPYELRGIRFKRILDLGSGSGRWALDMAYRHPSAEIVGVDTTPVLVEYARARAKTMQRDNVTFLHLDALTGNLDELGRQSYDLVNLRFGIGWVRGLDQWMTLLQRCYELNSIGGYTVMTEGEGFYTNSPALRRLYAIIVRALKCGGYGLPATEDDTGIAAQMGSLLHSSGFSEVGVKAGTIDFSFYNEEENMAWRNSFMALITECSTFFLAMGVTTPEELAELSVRVGSEMFAKDFCGVGSLFTFYGMRVK